MTCWHDGTLYMVFNIKTPYVLLVIVIGMLIAYSEAKKKGKRCDTVVCRTVSEGEKLWQKF